MREFVYLAAVAVMAAVVSGADLTKCPAQEPWNLPHELDCSKYYKCYMGRKFEFSCDPDMTGKQLCFVGGHQECGWWNNCNCIRQGECKSPEDNHRWPDPTDGHGYYQCQNGKVVKVTCKDNEVLDPTNLTCRPKQSTTCPPAGSGQLVRYPHDCLCQYYYECKDGQLTSQKCPDGKLFDADLLTCRPAKDARCNGTKNDCPPKGTHYYPSSESCYEYHKCVDGVKTSHRCKWGLIFDNVKLICVPWDKGNCNGKDYTTPRPDSCLAWDRPRKPNKNDCNRYYECVNGIVDDVKCLENHYFNEKTLLCDLKKNVNCNDGNGGNNGGGNKDCPLVDCGKVRYPHPNCEWYYECRGGKKVPVKCPAGLAFNKDSQMCDLPQNVQCSVPRPVCPTGSLVPHECQCTMYYRCKNDEKVLENCPAGMNFDEVTLNCVAPELAKCHKESGHKNRSFSQTLSHWIH